MPMSPLRTLLVTAAATLLAACGTTRDRDTAVDDNLNRDLELASSAGVQMAPQAGGLQVVSAVERVPRSAATSTRAPRPSPRHQHQEPKPLPVPVTSPEPSHDVSEVAQNATVVDATAPQPTEVPAPAPGPEAGDIPTPQPSSGSVGSGDTGRGGVGIGGILGGIGGVLVRGGGIGDDDHCEIEPGMPRGRHPRGGVIIDRRMPPGGGVPPVWRSGGGQSRPSGGGVPVWRSGGQRRTPATGGQVGDGIGNTGGWGTRGGK